MEEEALSIGSSTADRAGPDMLTEDEDGMAFPFVREEERLLAAAGLGPAGILCSLIIAYTRDLADDDESRTDVAGGDAACVAQSQPTCVHVVVL